MKILAIAPTPYFSDRGCHVQIYEESRALAARGHVVRLATYGRGRDVGGFPIRRIPPIPGYRKLSAGPTPWKAVADPMLFSLALREARAFRPDAIHAHLHEGAAIAYLVRHLTGVPYVAELQGGLGEELSRHGWPAAAGASRPLEAFLTASADAVAAQTERFAAELVRRWGAPSARTFVTGAGVDAEAFSPGAPPPGLAEELDLPDPSRVVVYLGLLSAYQGVDLLLAAAPRVLAESPGTRFLVMGYPGAERYREEARRLGIDAAFRFTGRVDYAQAPSYLRLGRVAVTPKRDVTEGNAKLLNYMAAGLAVAATGTSAHRAVAGETAAFFPEGDAGGLARTLVALLTDAPRREALGRAARERAARHLSWDAVAGRLEAAFETAMRRGS